MKSYLDIETRKKAICVRGRHFQLSWNTSTGLIDSVMLYDGLKWNSLLASGKNIGISFGLAVKSIDIVEQSEKMIKLKVVNASESIEIINEYEIYARGYIVGAFSLNILKDETFIPRDGHIGIALDEDVVFGNKYEIKGTGCDLANPYDIRGLSVNFSTDNRPVTNSINFLLEYQGENANGLPCKKIFEKNNNCRFMGWNVSDRPYPCPKGFNYTNRWCLAITALDNSPNNVRSQRIYQWYGTNPALPTDDVLIEMAEYGCSILILHSPTKFITTREMLDPVRTQQVVDRAHDLGMKVSAYCQPYLMSIEDPFHKDYMDHRTECLRIWHSMKDTQIVSYEERTQFDCDEMCLRSKKVFDYFFKDAIDTWERYGFDGLYIDFAWPAQGLCNNIEHGHKKGMFNFYDYLKLIREWREAIGEGQFMIGHGGGFLLGSDFIEGFDGCLTGEAQAEILPDVIGQQFGTAPTLWTMHRRKKDVFRSDKTIEAYVKEGLTPHCGVGIMGTSIEATYDPSHHPALIALWQVWRGFPVHEATFYNYLTEKVIELDNDEVVYSLYVTPEKHVLLILANAGGKKTDSSPAVGVAAKLDIKKLALPERMKCWRMKGGRYETFRVAEIGAVEDGYVCIPEIGKHEVVAFVMSTDQPPSELTDLIKHLDGRWDRLPEIMRKKQKRLAECDNIIDEFSKLPNASKKLSYQEFMKDRVAE